MRIPKIFFLSFIFLPFAMLGQKGNTVQKPEPAGRIFAILIGVADYTMLPRLKFSDKDALEFYFFLRKLSPADTNRFSIFLNRNATRDAIANKLYQVAAESRAGDRVFIYFSGHGDIEQLQLSNDFFLLLGNCGLKNYMGYSNSILEKSLFDRFSNELRSKKVKTIFICDACHAGKLVGGEKGKKISAEAVLNSAAEVKLLSCQPDQTSLESTKWGAGRSVFSYYLVLGLKGLADKDKDKKVSLSEINQYLSEHVKEAATIFNLSQWPSVSGDNDFAICKTSDALLYQAVQQSKQNGSSDDYNSLATEKGKMVKVGKNIFTYKFAANSNYLQVENNFLPPDTYVQAIYFSFKNAINTENLAIPEQPSAQYYYALLKDKTRDSSFHEEIKMTLLNALLQSYDNLLTDFYENRDTIFYYNLHSFNLQRLSLAAELSPPVDVLTNRIKSKQLFLQACLSAPSSDSAKMAQNAGIAISVLQDAIRLDSLNPAAYAKLSELHTVQQQYKEALDACGKYQFLLPNDAFMYNRKGLIYLSLHQFEPAINEFTKALELDPAYTQAQYNLQNAQQK